jgi:hypothetical protein
MKALLVRAFQPRQYGVSVDLGQKVALRLERLESKDCKVCSFSTAILEEPKYLENATPHNNPAGADCREILVVSQRLLAAAQPERYAESPL